MKQYFRMSLLIMIIAIFLCGCSEKDALVGVYMPKELSSQSDTIILYKDGTCQYFGDKHATWSADSDAVTITTYKPAEYYLDIYLDDMLSSAEMRAVGAKINRIESVISAEYLEDIRYYRVKIDKEESIQQAQAAIAEISGVKRVEEYIVELREIVHELKVVDNCLVTGGGGVYLRQGE